MKYTFRVLLNQLKNNSKDLKYGLDGFYRNHSTLIFIGLYILLIDIYISYNTPIELFQILKYLLITTYAFNIITRNLAIGLNESGNFIFIYQKLFISIEIIISVFNW